jgi:hypothetical protein
MCLQIGLGFLGKAAGHIFLQLGQLLGVGASVLRLALWAKQSLPCLSTGLFQLELMK